jgi:hypothetical protein
VFAFPVKKPSAIIDHVFGYGGNIVTHKRCSLSPDTVNALVTLKENFYMIDWGLDRNE